MQLKKRILTFREFERCSNPPQAWMQEEWKCTNFIRLISSLQGLDFKNIS